MRAARKPQESENEKGNHSNGAGSSAGNADGGRNGDLGGVMGSRHEMVEFEGQGAALGQHIEKEGVLETPEPVQEQCRRLQLTEGVFSFMPVGKDACRRSLPIEPHEDHGREDGKGRPEARGRPAATYPFSPMRIRAGARPRSDPESGIGVFGAVSDPGRRLEAMSRGRCPAAARSPAAAFAAMSIHAGGPRRRNRRTVDGAWRRSRTLPGSGGSARPTPVQAEWYRRGDGKRMRSVSNRTDCTNRQILLGRGLAKFRCRNWHGKFR